MYDKENVEQIIEDLNSARNLLIANLKLHPECINTDKMVRAIVMDSLPEFRAEKNILIILYNEGFITDVRNSQDIRITKGKYKTKLTGELGYTENLSVWCIDTWLSVLAELFGEKKYYDVIDDIRDYYIEIPNESVAESSDLAARLIGEVVMHLSSRRIGRITEINGNIVVIDFHGEVAKYEYPAAFANTLELEDEDLQDQISKVGTVASFDRFKREFLSALYKEISYLKTTGGKKYRIVDGERLPSKYNEYLYAFDTETELSFPDGTAIKIQYPDNTTVSANVVACEDLTILIRSSEYIGDKDLNVEFTAEQWHLTEALADRLKEMNPQSGTIPYEVACEGYKQINEWNSNIKTGQNAALNRALSEKITFIWGPPGTGKTEILADIALEHIDDGKRVLMLSYSNVSVDGALLRVAGKADLLAGRILRYGYPKTKELLDSRTLTTYRYVLSKNPVLEEEFKQLTEEKRHLRRNSTRRIEINKRLGKIRESILKYEEELIQNASFVATTISKAVIDGSIYSQNFDVVIFDEASMAYVPQIVFASSLARTNFVCIGDFQQLPSIVMNREDFRLTSDIFHYVGITKAVEEGHGHEWLVMLNIQYRMHHSIADFVNKFMYWGKLSTAERIYEGRNEIASLRPCPESAMAMIDLTGIYSVCLKTNDGSRINLLSALICLRLTEQFIGKYEVGIITPYSAQSRLLMAMVRDIRERDERWGRISCATVHQFQGSEKPVIIYDAVDCFRMPYPGSLLTTTRNDTANRLFNVAMTRSKGKFVLVANADYLIRKKISKELMFTKAITTMSQDGLNLSGTKILDELMPDVNENPYVYVEDRITSWETYIYDIETAEKEIHIEMPDLMDENDEFIKRLGAALKKVNEKGIDVAIRTADDITLPKTFRIYVTTHSYVTNPVTIIDKKIIWFGHPISDADFVSEGKTIPTKYFPCVRFEGVQTARMVKAVLDY